MKHPSLVKFYQFVLAYPLALLALLGLATGAILRLVIHDPHPGNSVWLITLIAGGLPLVWRTLRKLQQRKFASDVVAMLAIVTAIAMDQAFAGVIIVLMQSGGEALESYSLGRASSSLNQLMARAPRTAVKKADGELAEIDVALVKPGDILVVRPGDLVPVDGVVISAQADVDEAALTGEPVPLVKYTGDPLLSGSVNAGGSFDMRAERFSADSQYARIVNLVRQAQEERPPLQRLADSYAVWFTPLTLATCAAGWWVTGDPRTILAVLVVATPCPLILAVPVAVISAINRAASQSIVVKGGTALEQIGTAKAFIFDKTGTLTHGKPALEEVVPLSGFTAQDILAAAGSVEQMSSHIVGQALAASAIAQYGALPVPTNFNEVAGKGVEADVDGRHVLVGSSRFLTERIGTSGVIPGVTSAGEMEAFVSIDGRPAGLIRFKDTIRPGADSLMERLRAMGVNRLIMLTGDNAGNAIAVAEEIGIDEVKSNLLPEDKVNALRAVMNRYSPTVMVGDGINDAPALATATVGVAMGAHGTGITAEAADIVLMVDDITMAADAMAIGRRMLHIAKQSICVGLGLSFACMIAAVFGKIVPAEGAVLQEAIDIAVILNALRARFG